MKAGNTKHVHKPHGAHETIVVLGYVLGQFSVGGGVGGQGRTLFSFSLLPLHRAINLK